MSKSGVVEVNRRRLESGQIRQNRTRRGRLIMEAHIERGATRRRPQRRSVLFGPLGFIATMAIPAAIAIVGIVDLGFEEIDWPGAIVWGVVATAVFTAFSMMGAAMGMTRMDLLDLLGSAVFPPRTAASRGLGAVVHHMNGALLAVAWGYGVALVDLPANWATGLLWGGILTVLALWMMSAIGSVHPAIRRGEQEDPGPAATNFGVMTPVGSLMGHLVYGLVLGFTYANLPLS
jgi:hypothetical protein